MSSCCSRCQVQVRAAGPEFAVHRLQQGPEINATRIRVREETCSAHKEMNEIGVEMREGTGNVYNCGFSARGCHPDSPPVTFLITFQSSVPSPAHESNVRSSLPSAEPFAPAAHAGMQRLSQGALTGSGRGGRARNQDGAPRPAASHPPGEVQHSERHRRRQRGAPHGAGQGRTTRLPRRRRAGNA